MRRFRVNRKFWPIVVVLSMAVLFLAFGTFIRGIESEKIGRIIRPPHEVSALAVKGSTLWAGGQDGLFEIDRRTAKVKGSLGKSQRFEYVKDLLVDQREVLWIAHSKGLTSYDGKRFVNYTTREGLPDNRVNCIYEDSKGRLWIGTWSGAAYRENGRWKVLNRKSGLLVDMVNVMLQDSRGGLWFGSYAVREGGVSYNDGSRWIYLTTKNNKLPDANISSIMENSHGQILIASGFVDEGGLVRIRMHDRQIITSSILSQEDGLAGEKVRSLFEDASGVLWVASEYDGIARISRTGIDIFTIENGLSGNEVKDWLMDENGTLWMATNDGITLIRSDELEILRGEKEANP